MNNKEKYWLVKASQVWSHPELMQTDDSWFFADKSEKPPLPEEEWEGDREAYFGGLGFSNIVADGAGNYYMRDTNGNEVFWDHETNSLTPSEPIPAKAAGQMSNVAKMMRNLPTPPPLRERIIPLNENEEDMGPADPKDIPPEIGVGDATLENPDPKGYWGRHGD